MKATHTCPKCQSTNIIIAKAFPGTSTSNTVQLTKWGTHLGFFDRYICTSCGFIENYANLEDKRWRKWLKKKDAEIDPDADFV